MITTSMESYRVQPGSRVDLAKWDADDKSVFDGSKKDGKEVLPELTVRLDNRQERLWAGQKHKVRIVPSLPAVSIACSTISTLCFWPAHSSSWSLSSLTVSSGSTSLPSFLDPSKTLLSSASHLARSTLLPGCTR